MSVVNRVWNAETAPSDENGRESFVLDGAVGVDEFGLTLQVLYH